MVQDPPLSSQFIRRFIILCFFLTGLNLYAVQTSAASDIQTYYGPEDHPVDHLLSLYQHAEHSIYIVCFNITFRPVVKTLVTAKKKGVDVRIITDTGELENKNTHNAIKILIHAGIKVKVNKHDGLMHMKQVIIDDHINTSGSLNQTWSANYLNDERFDVITDFSNTRKAKDKFLAMWNDADRFSDLKEDF